MVVANTTLLLPLQPESDCERSCWAGASQEPKLPLLKYMADILSWHALLFELYRGEHAVSREVAAELPNLDAIERLPVGQQAAALELLDNYCDGFNAVREPLRSVLDLNEGRESMNMTLTAPS